MTARIAINGEHVMHVYTQSLDYLSIIFSVEQICVPIIETLIFKHNYPNPSYYLYIPEINKCTSMHVVRAPAAKAGGPGFYPAAILGLFLFRLVYTNANG